MLVISWNVNSLRNCEKAFLAFLHDYEPDIVMIQELRAHPDQLSFFLQMVPGYQVFFNDSGRPGYSGTAIYYKNSLNVQEISKHTGNEILDTEGRTIKLVLPDYTIYNFYTPNGTGNENRLAFKLEFYQEMLLLLQSEVALGKKVIFGGDLNVAATAIDLYNPSANQAHSGYLAVERKWFADILKLGFVDTFRLYEKRDSFYSWWNLRDPKRENNQGWRFDYLLTSANIPLSNIIDAKIYREVFGSDHCPVGVRVG
ncbi:MAG: exodeoxyribonuclease III [bacterium]